VAYPEFEKILLEEMKTLSEELESIYPHSQKEN
jgi:hypothetical protein